MERVLRGVSDANIRFDDLRALLTHLGFEERIRGGHHIFTKDDVPEILNLQPRGSQAKVYRVKQVRGVIVSHHPADESDGVRNAPKSQEDELNETDSEGGDDGR